MIIKNADGEREWDITIAFGDIEGEAFEIEHLFDPRGSETFDPTEATEVVTAEHGPKTLEPGDKILFEFIAD